MMFRAGVLLLLCLQLSHARNVSERIYVSLQEKTGFSACVRLTNANGVVGCSSPSGGARGVIHLVNSSDSLAWVLSDGPHHPYVPLLTQEFFTQENLLKFKKTSRVTGALLIMEKSAKSYAGSYSPDLKCPNQGIGLYPDTQCGWNAVGDNIMFTDFGYPIYALFAGSNLTSIMECATKYASGPNSDYPLCATTMKEYMYAVRDTFTCMTQGQYGPIFGATDRCLALKGRNVWGHVKARNASEKYGSREIIMVVTRLDSVALFQDLSPAADTSTAGMISLMAVIDALAAQSSGSDANWAKKIVFAVFNGESFDYIGSSRMVHDMQTQTYPAQVPTGDNILAPATFNLSNVKTIIELGQVGLSTVPNNLFMHYDSGSRNTSTLRDTLQKHGSGASINFTSGSGTLPPASSQMFLRDDPAIEVVQIADHGQTYTNQYYNSYLDDAENLMVADNSTTSNSIVQLTGVSTAVARTLAELAGADSATQQRITARNTYIRDLAQCFLVNFSCPLVKQSFSPDNDVSIYPAKSRYIGIDFGPNTYIVFSVQRLIAQSLSTFNDTLNSTSTCKAPSGDSLNSYFLMRTEANSSSTRCITAPIYTYVVQSPAFDDPPDYRSKRFSTWTESSWGALEMEIYLKPSPSSEHTALGVGLALLVVFFTLAWQINRVSPSLFDTSASHTS